MAMKISSTASSDDAPRTAHLRYLGYLAAGVAVVLATLELLLRAYIVPIDDSRANRVALVYTAEGRDVVLGDSHLYRAFINEEAFVNLARAGSSPHALEIVAREYFRFREPGRVILEASPQLFNFMMQKRKAQKHDEYFALHRLGLPFTTYVFEPGVSRQLALLWDPAELRRTTATSNGRKKLRGGVVEREAAHRRRLSRDARYAEAAERVRSNRPVAGVRDSEGFAAYRRTAELLAAKGADLCLARTPVDSAYQDLAAADERFAAAHEAMEELAREVGARYVDFRDLGLNLNVTSFTNADHLTTAAGGRYAEALSAACYPGSASAAIR